MNQKNGKVKNGELETEQKCVVDNVLNTTSLNNLKEKQHEPPLIFDYKRKIDKINQDLVPISKKPSILPKPIRYTQPPQLPQRNKVDPSKLDKN